METEITEIAPDVYRVSTFLDAANLTMNQFLVDGDEPLLFHTGYRALFPSVSEAIARLIPLDRLRWITFGHVEADECGSMNSWLEVAPAAEVAHGAMGCFVQVADLADRPPHPLQDGDVLATGRRRVRHIDTPHVPHGWDAGLMFEETTSTLLCGDLFTAFGRYPARTTSEIVGPALQAEDLGRATCLTPELGPTIRALADLHPSTLAPMHAPAYCRFRGSVSLRGSPTCRFSPSCQCLIPTNLSESSARSLSRKEIDAQSLARLPLMDRSAGCTERTRSRGLWSCPRCILRRCGVSTGHGLAADIRGGRCDRLAPTAWSLGTHRAGTRRR